MSAEADAAAAANNTNLPLTTLFNSYQGKMSVKSPKCNTVACARAKLCYMRSGSVALGQLCPQGYVMLGCVVPVQLRTKTNSHRRYGSVQSAFKPTS